MTALCFSCRTAGSGSHKGRRKSYEDADIVSDESDAGEEMSCWDMESYDDVLLLQKSKPNLVSLTVFLLLLPSRSDSLPRIRPLCSQTFLLVTFDVKLLDLKTGQLVRNINSEAAGHAAGDGDKLFNILMAKVWELGDHSMQVGRSFMLAVAGCSPPLHIVGVSVEEASGTGKFKTSLTFSQASTSHMQLLLLAFQCIPCVTHFCCLLPRV